MTGLAISLTLTRIGTKPTFDTIGIKNRCLRITSIIYVKENCFLINCGTLYYFNMKTRLFFLVLFFLFACERKQTQFHEEIGIEMALEHSEAFDIKEHVAAIQYIHLETNEECLLGEIRKIVKKEDYIFISDAVERLFLFNSSGKFIRRIGTAGRAPYEYLNMTDFVVDDSLTNVYINTIGYLFNYDLEGTFKAKMPLKSGNLQVFCIDGENRFYYIMPDARQENGTTSYEIIFIYDNTGNLIKTIDSNTVRTTGRLAYFNSIYRKKEGVYYKEEFGNIVYRINPDLSIDSVFQLNLGRYAFKPEDLEMSRKDTWEDHYRINTLFLFDNYVIFNMQKGLIGTNIEPIVYNRRKQTLIYPHYPPDPELKGIYLDGVKLTPVSDYNDQLICLISPKDLIENIEDLTGNLKTVAEKVDENSNPVLAVLEYDRN